MSADSPSTDAIRRFLTSGNWKVTFSTSVAAAGYKLARARQVIRCIAERLDTGDIEITANVIDRDGHQNEAIIALWTENGTLQLDASCNCAVGCCEHAAAAMEHLSRPNRLENAFGELPGVPDTKTLTETTPPPETTTQPAAPNTPGLHLHIQRRPDGEAYHWLPETYATAHASYGQHRYPLDPAGNLAPPRNRAAPDPAMGTLWAPDKKEWQPSLYWQRFLHEAIPALEKRGWTVTIAHNAAQKPRPSPRWKNAAGPSPSPTTPPKNPSASTPKAGAPNLSTTKAKAGSASPPDLKSTANASTSSPSLPP